MFCSTIIPTIARSSVKRAVLSVLDQGFPTDEHEVIVVNDSGRPLPEAAWQRDRRVLVLNTQRRERIFARNSGAAAARGEYLHFLDDDDWLLPGALENLQRLAQAHPQAGWLYGGSQLVDRQEQPVLQLHHGLTGNAFVQVMAGEWLPLQSSLIKAEAFFAIGGFTPLVFATQDVDLARRIALRCPVAGTEALVACIGMGAQGSSTDTKRAPEYSRWAREKILSEPNVFSRLRTSSTAPRWDGRITRIYATSVIWNLRHKRLFTALSRGAYAAASLLLAGRSLLVGEYWSSVARNYESESFARGWEEAGTSAQPPENQIQYTRAD
jgi:glycosyltransferase involved in cell wall biosynthesis